MATFVSKCSIFIAFLWLLLLLSSIDGRKVTGTNNICEFPSRLYKGVCFFNGPSCDKLCKEGEGAVGGHCPWGVCTCQYVCTNICESLSGAFKGLCFDHPPCAKTCREQENKFSGRCAPPDFNRCWCSYYC